MRPRLGAPLLSGQMPNLASPGSSSIPQDRRVAEGSPADLLQPLDRGFALAGGLKEHRGDVRACRGLVPGYGFAHLIEDSAQERGGLSIEHWRFPSYGAILPEPTRTGIHASYAG